ncbi:hypothetical protein AXG93_3719s1170 [Marchantia polymorpha subsp. ruderalis]|uniref:Uncharacterized protein n=1 Tax=Marchantia polymorpha subsp. ruderalis TaxID=1480154 RepID=A0A176VM53_MARPO|nr:hypothetical protein AXG93_3719s1170 [Marchantia polymorpha subsp. ruderalis]
MASRLRRGQKVGSQWAAFLQSHRRPTAKTQSQRPRVPKNLSVEIPESKEFYDTPTLKVGVGMVAVAIIAKLTMMVDRLVNETLNSIYGYKFWYKRNQFGLLSLLDLPIPALYDESQEEERVERKAREMVELQANQPKVISRELWDHLQQLPPRTPFESRIARDNARIRTGDPLSMEDVKDWATDVITDALARKEDSLQR